MPATKPKDDASILDQQADEIAVLKDELRQKNDELQRKNQALEGFIAENQALKEELGGRRRTTAGNEDGRQNEINARIERWRKSGAKP